MTWETLTGDAASIATSVITLVLLVNIVLAIITMFRERREPSSLWAWILVMFFVPLLGFCSGSSSAGDSPRRRSSPSSSGAGIDYDEVTSEQSRALVTGTLVPPTTPPAATRPWSSCCSETTGRGSARTTRSRCSTTAGRSSTG